MMPLERIETKIREIRGQKVILDCDLAALYGVSTKRLNQQVTRNVARFPGDFMFQLNREETELPDPQVEVSDSDQALRLHSAT